MGAISNPMSYAKGIGYIHTEVLGMSRPGSAAPDKQVLRSVPFDPASFKLSERVARQIVQDIVDRNLVAGDSLPNEVPMLELYRVSRSTLREALRILETNGLIRLRPGRNGGARVGNVDPSRFGRTLTLFLQMERTVFSELLEARVIIEPLMARVAADRKDASRLTALAEVMEAHEDLDGETDSGVYYSVAQDFHGVVAGLSGNHVLDLFGQSLKEIYVERVIAEHLPGVRWEAVKAEHEAVANAIFKGNGPLAEALMKDHMDRLSESFNERYSALNDEIIGWF